MHLTTRNPTYLRIASEYRFVDALPSRLDEHARHNNQGHTPRDWGKCTRLTHPSHRIHTRNVRDRSNIIEHVTLRQERQRLILSTSGFGTVMDRLPL